MATMEPVEEAAPDSDKPKAYISARHRHPEALSAENAKSSGNYLLAGICAILATLVYLAIMGFLWFDWKALQVA